MAVLQENMSGLLELEMMKAGVLNTNAHAQEMIPNFGELYHHLSGKIISVKQVVDIVVRTKHILMTLSGMAVAVVPSAPVAASTHHRGSASNFPSLPQTTLNLGCVVMKCSPMKTRPSK